MNYGGLPTERLHPLGGQLDTAGAEEIAALLIDEEILGAQVVRGQARALGEAATLVAGALRQGGRLIYVGAGTSGRLGALDAVELSPTFGCTREQVKSVLAGGRAALYRAVEGAEDRPGAAVGALRAMRLGGEDVVVAIAASGVTPFTRAALEEARRVGARSVFVTCAPVAEHGGWCDVLVGLPVGPELLQGSTRLKAGTATKLALNAISTGAMVQLGKVFRGRMVDVRATNRKLRARAVRIVQELCGVSGAQAQVLLGQAANEVKVAVAMGLLGRGAEEARAALEQAGGDLRHLK